MINTTDIDNILLARIPTQSTLPTELHTAMHYCVFNGGKRLRPLLTFATGAMLEVPSYLLENIAAAIEFIHCYSLVHDDLPAMDNADLRRGKASCHKAFDEATAILVGDALQTLAFKTLTTMKSHAELALELIQLLADSCGSQGMIGGQMLDLTALKKSITIEELYSLHELKTGKLIEAAISMPLACSTTLNAQNKSAFLSAAKKLGLAFQIQDDLLDLQSTTEQLGKPPRQDEKKLTFATMLPVKEAEDLLNSLFDSIFNTLNALPCNSDDLVHLIQSIAHRAY